MDHRTLCPNVWSLVCPFLRLVQVLQVNEVSADDAPLCRFCCHRGSLHRYGFRVLQAHGREGALDMDFIRHFAIRRWHFHILLRELNQ